jgi:4-hydroxybenzoyl-CoA reductase subunit beta
VRLPKFEYFEPRDLKEAVSILKKTPAAKILAGGTDLLINMKHRVETPEAIVNIKGIKGLDFVRQKNRAIRIGALTRLKRIYETPAIREKLRALAEAAAAVGSFHHQCMGSLAGNVCQQNRCRFFNQSRAWRSSRATCFKAGGKICHVVNKKEVCYSTYCGDVAPALLVLDASAVLTGPRGAREIPIAELFSGDGQTPLALKAGEILTEFVIPAAAVKGVSGYLKFANRGSIDFPIVGCAFWTSSKSKEYRVAFTAVDRKPVRAPAVESFLNGKALNAALIEEASGLAAKAATPVKTSVYSPSHKRKLMGLMLTQALSGPPRRSST